MKDSTRRVIFNVSLFLIVFGGVLAIGAFVWASLSSSVVKQCYDYGTVYYRYQPTFFNSDYYVETTKDHADFNKTACVRGLLMNGKEYRR